MVSTSVRAHGAYVPGLIWTLVRTDFKTRYHGTVGGYVWALLKPLSMFVVLLGVFSVIFSTDPNYHLNLIIGLFLWDFFSESSKAGIGALHAKGFLITRAKFPNWIVVLTSSSNAVFTLALFLVLIVVYVSLFRHALGVGEVALLGNPIKYSKTPVDYRLPPPRAGQQTDEVLTELLDLNEEEIQKLRDSGTI